MKTSRRWHKIVPLVGLVIILAAGVAVASAHVGAVSPGIIHSCVNSKSGEVKIVGATATRNKQDDKDKEDHGKHIWAPLDWNAIGPQGPQGDTGATGATGPAGPGGISAYEVISTTSSLNATDEKTQIAVCSAGNKVLGGGGSIVGEGSNTFSLVRSHPTNFGGGTNNAWQVAIREDPTYDTGGDYWQARAYAICATVSS